MRRAIAATIALIATGLILAGALAAPTQQPPDCSEGSCVHLPIVGAPPSPTPTATATSTPGPTATPEPLPPGVYALPNHSAFVDTIGYFEVVGEVINTTSYSIEFVRIPVDQLDSQGNVVSTTNGNIYVYTLRPGEVVCFRALLLDKNHPLYRFRPGEYRVTIDPVPSLTFSDVLAVAEPPHNYHILGQARNRAGAAVDSVIVSGTLYNAAGTVIDCDWGGTDDDPLLPNKTSRFDVFFSSRASYADVATYKIRADGALP